MSIDIPADRAAEMAAMIRHLLELLAEFAPAASPTAARRSKGPERLTIEQFCEELGIGPSTFYDWRAKGKAPKCKKLPNGRIVILRTEADRWFESLPEVA